MTAAIDPDAFINTPQGVVEDLLAKIDAAIVGHPRSQQTRIGPSQLGDPCTRSLLRALAGMRPPRRTGPYDGWLSTIGTATHGWLADLFTGRDSDRWLREQRVTVGQVAGVDIVGHADLFDLATGTVIDWKVLGELSHEKVRLHGPGQRYEVQLQSYAHGFAALGLPVRQVLLVALPRHKGLDSTVWWDDVYRPDVAEAALARATGLVRLTELVGLPAALDNFTPCDDWHCHWCRADRPAGPPPTLVPIPVSRKAP